MRKTRNELGMIALIVGAGAVGALATAYAGKAGRESAAEPTLGLQVIQVPAESDARDRAIAVTREGSKVRIRSTVSAAEDAQPIVYVDGVRVDGGRDEAMQKLDPDQIDRLEVLKGDAREGALRQRRPERRDPDLHEVQGRFVGLVWCRLQDGEPFAPRRLREAVVATDKIEPLGVLISGRERRRQLESVGSAQGMDPQQPDRSLANLLERLDLNPSVA